MARETDDREVIPVMVVDRNAAARDTVVRLLRLERDFVVVAAVSSKKDALAEIDDARPHVVLLNFDMRAAEDICEAITRRCQWTAVVVMSLRSDTATMQAAMYAGARQYLVSPVTPDRLYKTVQQVNMQMKSIREWHRNRRTP